MILIFTKLVTKKSVSEQDSIKRKENLQNIPPKGLSNLDNNQLPENQSNTEIDPKKSNKSKPNVGKKPETIKHPLDENKNNNTKTTDKKDGDISKNKNKDDKQKNKENKMSNSSTKMKDVMKQESNENEVYFFVTFQINNIRNYQVEMLKYLNVKKIIKGPNI